MNLIQLQPGYGGREVFAACIALPPDTSIFRKHSCDYSERNVTPVGDVEFCEMIIRKQGIQIPKPDFYPTWLSHWMHRDFGRFDTRFAPSNYWECPVFVKMADAYKSMPAKIILPGAVLPEGDIWVSQVVTFLQEWRYYVANGEVVTTGWYDGSDDDEPAPELGIDWPAGFCGAVDFGRLSTGEIALVECHHPYACGHYSDDNQAFVQWLIDGFNYMKANYSV